MTDYQQPHRPPLRGQNRYAEFKKPEQPDAENKNPISQSPNRRDLFTVTIIAATNNGGDMNKQASSEQRFIIDLVFKPNESELKLRPEETQLLLSYIGEILKEIEAAENEAAEKETDGRSSP